MKVNNTSGGPMGGNKNIKNPSTAKAKNFWGTTHRLFKYMSRRLIPITFVLILAISSVIFQIQTPKILGGTTTEIYQGVMEGIAKTKKR